LSNIFHSLSKYAQLSTENFLTESFVYVLQQCLARSPTAKMLLGQLIGLDLVHDLSTPAPIELSTQVSLEGGIPDIQIMVPGALHCYVEVKHDSHLGEGQLEYYHDLLQQSPEPLKSLVLLTRSRASAAETKLTSSQYHHVCWYEIHRWLHELEGHDEVLDYLIRDFTNFLEEKSMSHTRINWQYEEGVASLIDFTIMLESAIGETMVDRKVTKSAGWSWRGFYVDGDVFVGIRYDMPVLLVFENDTGNNPTFKRDLHLPAVHFFSLDAGEQYEAIVNFLTISSKEYFV
jgi:hypothetical protein